MVMSDADELQRAHAGAEQHEIAEHHEDVDRHLVERVVDARGEVGGDVDEDVEGREADGAVEQVEPPVLPQRRPVAAQRADGERQDREERADPAQGDQRVGVDVADRGLAGDDVAAPEQGRQRQDEVGLGQKALKAPVLVRAQAAGTLRLL